MRTTLEMFEAIPATAQQLLDSPDVLRSAGVRCADERNIGWLELKLLYPASTHQW
jgi:hypothetical protein